MAIDKFLVEMGLLGELDTSQDLQRRSSKFGLIIGPTSMTDQLLTLVAYLALAGTVNVLDAGNHFDLIQVAYTIRRATPDLHIIADRVKVVRAFTCIEAVKGLQQMEAGAPLIIIDLLATFYDDAVSDKRSLLLVEECLSQIGRLKAEAGVVASVRDDCSEDSSRAGLLPLLRAGADIVDLQQVSEIALQPRMF